MTTKEQAQAALDNALNALYLEVAPDIVNDLRCKISTALEAMAGEKEK